MLIADPDYLNQGTEVVIDTANSTIEMVVLLLKRSWKH